MAKNRVKSLQKDQATLRRTARGAAVADSSLDAKIHKDRRSISAVSLLCFGPRKEWNFGR